MTVKLPTPEEGIYVLRALYSTATYDRQLGDRERSMLNAARQALGIKTPIEALKKIEPQELAASVSDPQIRHQAVTAMVIMALLDEEGSPEDTSFVEGYAQALGVSPSELRNLRQISEKKLLTLHYDLARRVWLGEHLKAKWNAGGFKWLARAIGTKLGLKEDTSLAERYRALANYKEGTVGRIYYDHMREAGFPLPGEKGSQIESVIIHDMTHLLSGYGTDPIGEIQTASFSAGNRREEPFTYIFFVICQHHLGIVKAPFAFNTQGDYDAAASIAAVKRGMAVKQDLSSGWDPWTIMNMPLEEARTSLGVPPLQD